MTLQSHREKAPRLRLAVEVQLRDAMDLFLHTNQNQAEGFLLPTQTSTSLIKSRVGRQLNFSKNNVDGQQLREGTVALWNAPGITTL